MSREPTLVPVILSGGSGTRLWPLSRELFPKQLLPLFGPQSLLQDTLRRAQAASASAPLLICNHAHRFLVAEQARAAAARPDAILLEPVGRNTAPAIAVAAFEARQRHGVNALLLVLPADHVIRDVDAFALATALAVRLAAAGQAVTFGIHPTRPETGFGYLKSGAPIVGEPGAFELEAFIEKPDADAAARLVASGTHYWNSGMFVFPVGWFIDHLAEFEPDMARCAETAWQHAVRDSDFVRLDSAAFEAAPSNSVDYAVMERVADAAMVPLDAGWDDVGSFTALWDLGARDAMDNVLVGDAIAEDSSACYVRADSRCVATLGVRDLIVIETNDAVLVAHRSAVQDVRRLVTRLKAEGRIDLVEGPPSADE